MLYLNTHVYAHLSKEKKAHCMGRSYLEMPHNTPTQEYPKKKFISQNFKGKKIHWFAVFANMSVNSYLHSNMSINIPTVTDFKLNVDLERNANHYTAFLQYKDNRQEYLQEHPCQENIVN